MANEKKEPPKSAEELLERYAAGERDFRGIRLEAADLRSAILPHTCLERANLSRAILAHSYLRGADLTDAHLSGANLECAILYQATLERAVFFVANLQGANLAGARLRSAKLERAKLERTELTAADLRDADLRGTSLASTTLVGADLEDSDLRFVEFHGANLEGAKLSHAALAHDADLLTANWQTLRFGNKTYHRDAVERGEEVLPVGMGPRLAVLIETVRLRGSKIEAASAVVDYLASAGIQAEVANAGGAGSTIKLSVRSKDDAEILLQAGDGVCRLLGLGSGVENLLPANSNLANQVTEAIVPLLDERFDLARRQSHLEADELLATLETIGREDLRSVKLAGFTDVQMEALKNLAELGSEYLEVKVDEENKEAWMTPGQQVARDVYESQVAKPLRTIIAAVFQSLTERPGDL